MTATHDVLVVGSGPLGVCVARRLAERGRDVLILEAGPAITDPPGSHVRNAARFRDDPDAYLGVATAHLAFFDATVARDRLPGAAVTTVRGGQGTIWTNLCPRGDAPWDALTPAQWDNYYGIAEGYLGVQSEGFERSIRQRRIREKLDAWLTHEGRRIETLPVAAQFDETDHLHFTAPYDILAGAGAAASRITIADTGADRLVTDGSRIVGIVAGGTTIAADGVVIAAGAIGTPQLLHRSGIRPKALGRRLSYHPLLVAQMVLNEALCAGPGPRDREPRLQIRPNDTADWYALVLRDVSPFQPEEPDIDIDPNRLAEIQTICPVDLDEDKAIRFDDKSRPTFDVRLSPADRARMDHALADCDAIVAKLGRYRSGCRPDWMPLGFAHMTGTTRMSATDDGTGVADRDGRVWGFDNLYLATNGLIPTRMAVNPTLTGAALSIRTADRIVDA